MSGPPGIDRFDDCRQCGGEYRYYTKLGLEMCLECGHRRRYSDDATHWWHRAACRNVGLERFFPPQGAPVAPAKAVCATCPVVAACRTYALVNDERFGIWGGLTERERRFIRAATGRVDRTCGDCGVEFTTTGPGRRHRMYCDECSTQSARARRRRARVQADSHRHAS